METQKEKPDLPSRELFEKAVEDAQFLVAHAAGICKKNIDGETLNTLITAKRLIDENQPISVEFEVKFWLAHQATVELVRPVTANSIRANLEMPPDSKPFKNIPLLSQWVRRRPMYKSRQAVNQYIFFTVFVLILLLIFQIYWVIGNQLTIQLADLLQRETELSQEINTNQQQYSVIEVRFKQNEMDSENFKTNGVYTFYSSPEWERDILENVSARSRLETDLESLKSQLERNSAILLVWSRPWNWLIEQNVTGISPTGKDQKDQYDSQIKSIDRQMAEIKAQLREDPEGSRKIQEARNQIDNVQKQLIKLETNPEANADQILSLRSEMDSLTSWVNQPGLADQIVSQLNQDLERLTGEKEALERQRQGAINRESSRQAQLAGQFVLVILQSYLLPLLYGILGAATSALRALSKEIEEVTYSEQTGTQHVLRISLGALAGIMVGWFSFLIPNETTTFVGSISPLAIAFLVGYNIELFFSLMDKALNWVNEKVKVNEKAQQPSSTTESQQTTDSPKNKPTATTKRTTVTGKAHTLKPGR